MTGDDATPLPDCNDLHYDRLVFERVDWSHRGEYMHRKHRITPAIANEALEDPNRLVIDPDYNSTSGRSVRIIGFSPMAGDIITVIVMADKGIEYGVNGWVSNATDRRLYQEFDAPGEIST